MSVEGLQGTLIFLGIGITIVNFIVILLVVFLKTKKPSQIPLILFLIHFAMVTIGILLDTDHYGWNNLGYGILVFTGVGTVLLNGLLTLIYRTLSKSKIK